MFFSEILFFLREVLFFEQTGILRTDERIINFFISEDNCDDNDESYSIRVGWWLVGLGLDLGSGCGTVGLGLSLGLGLGFVISEDNCDDDDESYSIRAGWSV